ncbi:MAG TPA: serine/threonine-protein kinase [Candidatus Obscuribacterales bacterium]
MVPAGKSPLIGFKVEDRYRILCAIGHGSMGSVYKAIDETTGRLMAIKLLNSSRAADEKAQRRFFREAKTISHLNHPNIVKLFHFGKIDDELPYIVTEFLNGKTLAQKIREEKYLKLDEALPIIQQVISAVAEAHRAQIIHRDLKPENIVLEETGVRVLDFGVAKMVYDTGEPSMSLTLDGKVCGSPGYMSPEQCRGEELDFRSDIYALGVVIFEMLTGSRPFNSDDVMGLMFMHVNKQPPSMSSMRVDLAFPQALESAVMKALSKDRYGRQQTVEELWDDIELAVSKVSFGDKGKAQSSWIPFEQPTPRLLDMAQRESAQVTREDHPARAVLAEARAPKTVVKQELPRGVKHRLSILVASTISLFLLIVAVKLVQPVNTRPDLDRIEDMIAAGRTDEAIANLDHIRRQNLTNDEAEYVNDLFLKIGMKYGREKNYYKAVDALLRVSKSSRYEKKASTLVRKYNKAASGS